MMTCLGAGSYMSMLHIVILEISKIWSNRLVSRGAQTRLKPNLDKGNDVPKRIGMDCILRGMMATARHKLFDYYINPSISGDNLGISTPVKAPWSDV
jgi:hypothetical protein